MALGGWHALPRHSSPNPLPQVNDVYIVAESNGLPMRLRGLGSNSPPRMLSGAN